MNNLFIVFAALLFSLSAFAQNKFADFDDCDIYFHGIFDDQSSIDPYGVTKLDMGDGSGGRIQFRITDVNVKMVQRGDEPGCGNNCEDRIIIYFECKKGDCIQDPFLPEISFPEGAIQIYDLKLGKKAHQFLLDFQTFIFDDLSGKGR